MTRTEQEQLFSGLYQENRPRILRLCRGYLGSEQEAEDLFQEIMVNVWNSLPAFRNEARITTWIYRIAVNTALLYRKRWRRRETISAPLDPDRIEHAAVAQDRHDDERRLRDLHNAIATLASQDRLIITLLLDGLSYRDISDITGISTNYVGVKISRIKQTLEKRVTEVANGAI